LWGGNIMLGSGQVNGFLDPALYYADPEIELAFVHLFATFGETFFNRYNDIRPIDSGFWESRRDIYALYPMLIQVRRGEQAPLVKIESIVDRFVG
jgi:fructosamine-3-kinase